MVKETSGKGGRTINIPHDLTGQNLSIGDNQINQKKVEGVHVNGVITELQAGEADYVNRKGQELEITKKKGEAC